MRLLNFNKKYAGNVTFFRSLRRQRDVADRLHPGPGRRRRPVQKRPGGHLAAGAAALRQDTRIRQMDVSMARI